MNKIIFTNPDGSVGIITPTKSVAEAMKDVPANATNVRECLPEEAYPDGRLYRNAYRLNGGGLPEPDTALAAEIAHGRRRAKRDIAFAPHLAVTSKAAQGIPLKAGESVQVAQDAMTNYKTNVDDVAQIAIDNATSWQEIKAAGIL